VYHRVGFDSLPRLVALNKGHLAALCIFGLVRLCILCTGSRPVKAAGFLVLSLVDPICPESAFNARRWGESAMGA
jgi:hypothetical protein